MYEAQAQEWLSGDPDPSTREEIQALLDLNDQPGLEDRFGSQLTFGTAGMRGQLGAGPNRMNRAQVRRVTAALVRVLATEGSSGKEVVVGRDHRHGSDEFAADTAMVLAGGGYIVRSWLNIVPTPLVAWATRQFNARAGVMITASHNPPADNGYKVYWSGGAQIIPPIDSLISQKIPKISQEAISMASESSDLIRGIDESVREDYINACLALLPEVHHERGKNLRIVYTAMHGVGTETMVEVLNRAGFTDIHLVEEQCTPDPDFPTVEFPNPEEEGALDLAFKLAKEVEADIILANDPDADRIGVAIPTPSGWARLAGDDVGSVLAYDIVNNRLEKDRLHGDKEPLMATTVVSSQLMSKICEKHNVAYKETLTGFKWMANAAAEGEEQGQKLVLSYEQALGVCVGDIVRDKDGISGGLILADLAERAKLAGKGLSGLINDMSIEYGAHVSAEDSVEMDDPEIIQRLLDGLRADWPTTIEGAKVVAIADHDAGVTTFSDGSVEEISLPATALIRFSCEDGSRVMVRPSGTEPKLKFYAEAVEEVVEGHAIKARSRAASRARDMLQDFIAGTMARAGISAV